MKNSKKIVAIALALVMLVGGVIAGTMAWFVDDEAATNVIEVGDIGILLHEADNADLKATGVKKDGDYRTWLANQWMMPSEGNDGNQLAKYVTVENNGTNNAYVRVKIYVPTNIAPVIHFNQVTGASDWTAIATAIANAKDVTIDTVAYKEYTLYYKTGTETLAGNQNATVDATKDDNAITSAAIDSIYLDKYVDCDDTGKYWYKDAELTELSADGKANIFVVAEAIQAAGHADADAAWEDFEDQVGNDYEKEDYDPYYEPTTIAP